MAKKQEKELIEYGKSFVKKDAIVAICSETGGNHLVNVVYGYRNFETDQYKKRKCALWEAKGFLQGLRERIDSYIEHIDMELEKEETK